MRTAYEERIRSFEQAMSARDATIARLQDAALATSQEYQQVGLHKRPWCC